MAPMVSGRKTNRYVSRRAVSDARRRYRNIATRGPDSSLFASDGWHVLVEISTSPGYMPSKFSEELNKIYDESVVELIGESALGRMPHRTSSTDMGDVSAIMPAMQSYAGGASGRTHSNEFEITDWDLDVVVAGKALAFTAISLLSDDAKRGRKIADEFEAPFTIAEYLAALREFRQSESWSD